MSEVVGLVRVPCIRLPSLFSAAAWVGHGSKEAFAKGGHGVDNAHRTVTVTGTFNTPLQRSSEVDHVTGTRMTAAMLTPHTAAPEGGYKALIRWAVALGFPLVKRGNIHTATDQVRPRRNNHTVHGG